MKVEIHSKKFIKPSIPTPPSLGNYKISLVDELSPGIYVPLILYYPANGNNDKHFFWSTCVQLRRSLRQTLVQFYPLAGRYNKDIRAVDCHDQGVKFVEAKVDCELDEVLSQGPKKLDPRLLNRLIASDMGTFDESTDPLLSIQVTMFECGGWALSICISHRIVDAATLNIFIKAWATTNQKEPQGIQLQTIGSGFNSPSFFLARGLPEISLEALKTKNKIVTKKLLFDKKAISTLRTNSRPKGSDNFKPTSRVQLVNAVIWKALVGVERLKDEQSRASVIFQAVNLRGKTPLPLSNQYCGNFCTMASLPMMSGENMEVQGLADQLSNSVRVSFEQWAQLMSLGDPYIKNFIGSMVNYYMISSWSRFPFYEADFGWGKPAWTSSANLPIKNCIILMDDKEGDGIEAWVNLDEKDMLIFQQDCDIQALTT